MIGSAEIAHFPSLPDAVAFHRKELSVILGLYGRMVAAGLWRDYGISMLRDAAVFAPCYVALDWASYIAPLGDFNLTPWNPQPALAIAWMYLAGPRHLPAVALSVFVAEALVRGLPAGVGMTVLTATALAGGYAATAWALRSPLALRPDLRSTRDLTLFVAASIGAGFAALGAFSDFFGLRLFGILMPAAMAISSIAALSLMPVLVLRTRPAFLFGAAPSAGAGVEPRPALP